MQKVINDRIFETTTGQEIMWRGEGGSYLFHAGANYQQVWQQQLPNMRAMGINTVRLAFGFVNSTPNPSTGLPTADVFDFTKMDWVLNFLSQNGIKGILDCHNYDDMAGDFGSSKLINDWMQVAQHYHGDERVAAYELFNEPFGSTHAPSVVTAVDGINAYRQITDVIRTVDPDHIVIWGVEWFTPDLADVLSLLRPNVVYTFHRWYGNSNFSAFSSEQLSYMSLAYAVEQRKRYNVPFWFGEFGSASPYNSTNIEWNLAEQSCWRCEEQVVGWNLWNGGIGAVSNYYLGFFPLKIYNSNLVRQPWNPPFVSLMDYITASQGVDVLTPYQVSMWHNGDFVTFRPGITVRYIRTQVQANGSNKVIEDVIVQVTQPLTLTNIEGTTDHPGDWNLNVYSIILPPPIPLWKLGSFILLLLGSTGMVMTR